MKHLFLFFTVFSFSLSFGQTLEKSINSAEFETSRKFKINLPEGYKNDTIKKYPIAIVLDDDYLFDLYLGNSKVFAETDLAPQQIVVGVNTNYGINEDVSVVGKNGGLTKNAKKFYNFIKKELVPYLEGNLKTSPFLSIVGQGKSANFLTHFLKEPQPLFNAYTAISPAFNTNTLNLFSSYNLKRFGDIDNTFFLYISNNNLTSEDSRVRTDKIYDGLQSMEVSNFIVTNDKFKDSPNLPTAISSAIPQSLSIVFEKYARISKKEYEETIKEMAPLDAIEYLENRYIDIEYLYGTNLNVRIEDILAIESIVMDQQGGDYLRVLGEFTMIKLPNSPLGEYYTGMFYELGKDYERADTYYRSGYGKMDPSDPKTDLFYKNIERITTLKESAPQEELLPLEEEPLDEEPLEEENPEEQNNELPDEENTDE